MIAYVDSPFQLLQCFEFQNNNQKIKRVYVRLNKQLENNHQLKGLIKLLNINNVKLITISTFLEKAIYYSYLFKLTLFEDKLILGDSNSFLFKLLKMFFKKEKFILLDDGVATINDRKVNKTFQRFTIFPEYVLNSIINDFKSVKKLVDIESCNLMHVIVGGKFIDEGICSETTYDKAIKAIIDELDDGVSYVYISHRGESTKQLERLRRKFSFRILRTQYPIELLTLETKIYPATISHVLSTAVYSMRRIYEKVPIYTYRLESDEILSRKVPIENLYREMENEAFSVFINNH